MPDNIRYQMNPRAVQSLRVACAVIVATVLAVVTLGLLGCETRVIKDNSVDAQLERSMPAGNLRNGHGGDYTPRHVPGTAVPHGYIPNSAAPGNWVHGFGP